MQDFVTIHLMMVVRLVWVQTTVKVVIRANNMHPPKKKGLEAMQPNKEYQFDQ